MIWVPYMLAGDARVERKNSGGHAAPGRISDVQCGQRVALIEIRDAQNGQSRESSDGPAGAGVFSLLI